ncbi:flagellar protein FlaG [Biomaibacter acetigenes]|uniref:Flagellar protein FlaG n=1 Tax=Biomaibacter acetigenes TaxID=2316383 RepID=A0A3G2R358_9FIRM|nr:flagellar protein FlaG [Biomaibacter acetigenes]AYO29934.1 flagellar protein FlaG [Biomaibacter acetigenes]
MWGDKVRVEGIANSGGYMPMADSMAKETAASSEVEVTNTKESNGGSIDFKKVIGKKDFDTIVQGLKNIAKELKETRFEFSIHKATKRVIVKIFDKNTDKLITEIPPEKILDLIASIWEQAGFIVDKKV